ncbi:hypothetical protein HanIR_Chr08g0375751 [Helianthus annuus]|nr:hypothetical protein HanIR_Chr08g0375751 [Helianthus annuus]
MKFNLTKRLLSDPFVTENPLFCNVYHKFNSFLRTFKKCYKTFNLPFQNTLYYLISFA